MSVDRPDDLDDLVPLYRRRAFDRDLGTASAAALASGEPLSLVMLDGDGFKQINDLHGHAKGDEVLRALGDMIRRRVKGKGRGYRFGGDEFGRTGDHAPRGVNEAMDEMFVRGFNTPIEIQRSPFFDLLPILEADPAAFLRVARLLATLQLRLSRVVEHVFRLELRLDGRTLHVEFEGQRSRRWTNEEPTVIRVSGTLDLGASQPAHLQERRARRP